MTKNGDTVQEKDVQEKIVSRTGFESEDAFVAKDRFSCPGWLHGLRIIDNPALCRCMVVQS